MIHKVTKRVFYFILNQLVSTTHRFCLKILDLLFYSITKKRKVKKKKKDKTFIGVLFISGWGDGDSYFPHPGNEKHIQIKKRLKLLILFLFFFFFSNSKKSTKPFFRIQ